MLWLSGFLCGVSVGMLLLLGIAFIAVKKGEKKDKDVK